MRKKLTRFKDNKTASNLIQEGKPLYKKIKGNWHTYFGNQNPIALELGCGRGNYTVKLAERHQQSNFIGIDIKGARLWAGSQEALHEKLLNAAFLRADITLLDNFFAPKEITELFITFPDPRPRGKEAKKRLTSPRFLSLYENLLPKGGQLHLKTDNLPLFLYTCETIVQSRFEIIQTSKNLYKDLPPDSIHQQIQTPYEKKFLAEGKTIKYLQCVLK